jgi:hypothetical protein
MAALPRITAPTELMRVAARSYSTGVLQHFSTSPFLRMEHCLSRMAVLLVPQEAHFLILALMSHNTTRY